MERCISAFLDIGEAQGALTSDHQIFLNATAGTKTLVHEIAHYLADHLESSKDHKQRELEAEAVAYAVCRHFGFEDLKSPNYLYLTGLKAEDLKSSLTIISTLAQEMIDKIEIFINYEYEQCQINSPIQKNWLN